MVNRAKSILDEAVSINSILPQIFPTARNSVMFEYNTINMTGVIEVFSSKTTFFAKKTISDVSELRSFLSEIKNAEINN